MRQLHWGELGSNLLKYVPEPRSGERHCWMRQLRCGELGSSLPLRSRLGSLFLLAGSSLEVPEMAWGDLRMLCLWGLRRRGSSRRLAMYQRLSAINTMRILNASVCFSAVALWTFTGIVLTRDFRKDCGKFADADSVR